MEDLGSQDEKGKESLKGEGNGKRGSGVVSGRGFRGLMRRKNPQKPETSLYQYFLERESSPRDSDLHANGPETFALHDLDHRLCQAGHTVDCAVPCCATLPQAIDYLVGRDVSSQPEAKKNCFQFNSFEQQRKSQHSNQRSLADLNVGHTNRRGSLTKKKKGECHAFFITSAEIGTNHTRAVPSSPPPSRAPTEPRPERPLGLQSPSTQGNEKIASRSTERNLRVSEADLGRKRIDFEGRKWRI
ncbi:hypothetical protein MRB53_024484 [Persea americana]|uniref:Uncharacterized protein n=1 Tax=Persea americana TaxID=3435 RepID=A0ACC2LD80_PERAE|nr:hypothetical protein MRB53_024484 [Persea americana]